MKYYLSEGKKLSVYHVFQRLNLLKVSFTITEYVRQNYSPSCMLISDGIWIDVSKKLEKFMFFLSFKKFVDMRGN